MVHQHPGDLPAVGPPDRHAVALREGQGLVLLAGPVEALARDARAGTVVAVAVPRAEVLEQDVVQHQPLDRDHVAARVGHVRAHPDDVAVHPRAGDGARVLPDLVAAEGHRSVAERVRPEPRLGGLALARAEDRHGERDRDRKCGERQGWTKA